MDNGLNHKKEGKKTLATFFTLVLYKIFIVIYNCHQYQETLKILPRNKPLQGNSLDIV